MRCRPVQLRGLQRGLPARVLPQMPRLRRPALEVGGEAVEAAVVGEGVVAGRRHSVLLPIKREGSRISKL